LVEPLEVGQSQFAGLQMILLAQLVFKLPDHAFIAPVRIPREGERDSGVIANGVPGRRQTRFRDEREWFSRTPGMAFAMIPE